MKYPIGIQNFEGDGRTLYKIGVSFSSETRRMVEWKVRQ